jgi:hypothetical protein
MIFLVFWIPESGKDGHWTEVLSMPRMAAGDPEQKSELNESGHADES